MTGKTIHGPPDCPSMPKDRPVRLRVSDLPGNDARNLPARGLPVCSQELPLRVLS